MSKVTFKVGDFILIDHEIILTVCEVIRITNGVIHLHHPNSKWFTFNTSFEIADLLLYNPRHATPLDKLL